MSERYADQLRAEAGRLEAQIAALTDLRAGWYVIWREADDQSVDLAAQKLDDIDNQIGALEQRLQTLDDEIHDEDPERPWTAGVL